MAFMQPETYHGPYYVVDTGACGITFIPCDVHPGASDPAELRDYVESTSDPTGWELEVKTGWLGRYQAPGYLDCTDWTPGDSEEELLAELRDMYGGDDDESDDKADVPNLDAMDADDLRQFADDVASDALLADAPEDVRHALIRYASDRLVAIAHRLAGRIEAALLVERQMEQTYQSLPAAYRW